MENRTQKKNRKQDSAQKTEYEKRKMTTRNRKMKTDSRKEAMANRNGKQKTISQPLFLDSYSSFEVQYGKKICSETIKYPGLGNQLGNAVFPMIHRLPGEFKPESHLFPTFA